MSQAGLTRRQVLGAALAGGAAAGLAGCTTGSDSGSPSASGQPVALPTFHTETRDGTGDQAGHQIGIAEHALGFGLLAAMTVVDDDVAALKTTLQALTGEAHRITDGLPTEARDPTLPPVDTGVLVDTGTRVRVTAALGASLFDGRFGLAALHPRTAADEDRVLLRKGFSYTRGFDGAGTLDQGLAFVSFQRRLDHFLVATERLRGEPLEEYVRPEGGGFYVVPSGVPAGGYLGQQLLEA